MSDSYQAIYDAVRSRIGGGNIGQEVADAARRAFDIGYILQHAQQEIYTVSDRMTRPSVLFRPELSRAGDRWKVWYGEVSGVGDTPREAMSDFDNNWMNQRPVDNGGEEITS